MTRLLDVFSDTRVIARGEAAGLKLVASGADPNFLHGTYEQPMQQAIVSNLTPEGVFFDIGANIGFFSLIAARRTGPGGQIYAFEPVPRNADAIARTAQLNGLDTIQVYTEAVGAASGRAELLLAHHIGGAALASADIPPDLSGHLDVEITTLDDAIRKRGLRSPSLVKIDVEGAEMDVLRGMKETLHAHRTKIIYEIDDATRDGLERKAREIAAFLASAGYALTPLPASYDNQHWQVEHMLAQPLGV